MASAIKGSVVSALNNEAFDQSQITYEKIDLSLVDDPTKLAFVLRNVFSKKECKKLIQISEEYGYLPAMINVSDGVAVSIPGYRDGHRIMIDDKEFSQFLFERISSHLPKKFGRDYKHNWDLLEINERMRFLRYKGPSDKFAPHTDGAYIRKYNECETFITLQIYLNDEFNGGATTFLKRVGQERIPVQPEPGMILVFQHDIYHEGSVVTSGTKYTIRTDVLYQRAQENENEKPKKWFNFFS